MKIKKKNKNEKNAWRYHHFTHVYQKLWLDDVQFLRNGAQQTVGETDRKSDTEMGSPPKNYEKPKSGQDFGQFVHIWATKNFFMGFTSTNSKTLFQSIFLCNF